MSSEVSIDFSRLREFSDRLRGVNLPAAVMRAERDAAQIVARQAIPRIPVVSGDARGSVSIVESGQGVGVTAGAGVPYFGWLDFGGAVGENKSITRPYLRTGRYIWRAFADNRSIIMERMGDAINEAFGEQGIDVN